MRVATRPIGRLLPICFICLVFFVIYTIYVEFVCIPFFQFDVDPQYRLQSLRNEGEHHLLYRESLLLKYITRSSHSCDIAHLVVYCDQFN